MIGAQVHLISHFIQTGLPSEVVPDVSYGICDAIEIYIPL
jgi:hypothetical protein